MKITVLIAACLSCFAPGPPLSHDARRLELVLRGHGDAFRIRLEVEVGGRALSRCWDDAFTALFRWADRDQNGLLNRAEANRLPSPFGLRQGPTLLHPGRPPAWEELDGDRDGCVTCAEMIACYRRFRLGQVLASYARRNSASRMTRTFLDRLDLNRDGRVDESEWRSAAKSLMILDKNDDELITPDEVVPDIASGGAVVGLLREASESRLAYVGSTTLPDSTPGTTCKLALDVPPGKPSFGLVAKESNKLGRQDGPVTFESGRTILHMQAADGELLNEYRAFRERLLARFEDADADRNGVVDEKEAARAGRPEIQRAVQVAGGKVDGQLTRTDLCGWLDLQEHFVRCHLRFAVLDKGAGLFELLDADHDDALSIRELRGAWERARGYLKKGRLDEGQLPVQMIATLGRGYVPVTWRTQRDGPAWFKAMDRNGDGDLSRREFTGPAEVFERLDIDKDGLLSPEEAARQKRARESNTTIRQNVISIPAQLRF